MSRARCPSLGSNAGVAIYGENRQPWPMSDRPFDLVIFDCDGVPVDSEPVINRAHAQVLTACGYPISEDELLARFCGMSDAEMLATIEHESGRTLPPSYAERADSGGSRPRIRDDVARLSDASAGPIRVRSFGFCTGERMPAERTMMRQVREVLR